MPHPPGKFWASKARLRGSITTAGSRGGKNRLSAELLQLGKRLELGLIARALGVLGKVVEAAPGIDRHAWLYTRVMAVKTLSVVAHAYDVALARNVPLRRIDVTAAGPPPSFSRRVRRCYCRRYRRYCRRYRSSAEFH